MPEQHNQHHLDPALRELESALGDMMPCGANAIGTICVPSAQRDQLMFAMGQAAGRKRSRHTQVATALIALLVGTLVTLPWRFGAQPQTSGVDQGQLVQQGNAGKVKTDGRTDASTDASTDDSKRDTGLPNQKPDMVNHDQSDLETAPPTWALFDAIGKQFTDRPKDDQRYSSLRDRVLEHGIDALPDASTGIAGGMQPTLMHRSGRDTGSF